jgi:hypothetical protein
MSVGLWISTECTGYGIVWTQSDMPRPVVTIVMISTTVNRKTVSLKRAVIQHSRGIGDDVMLVVLLPALGLFDMFELNSRNVDIEVTSDSDRSSTWPCLFETYLTS